MRFRVEKPCVIDGGGLPHLFYVPGIGIGDGLAVARFHGTGLGALAQCVRFDPREDAFRDRKIRPEKQILAADEQQSFMGDSCLTV